MFSFTILDFQKFEIFTDDPLQGPICVTMPNFIKIGRKLAEIWRFKSLDLTVFLMADGRQLRFVGCLLGPPTMTTWWSLSLCQIWLKSMQ